MKDLNTRFGKRRCQEDEGGIWEFWLFVIALVFLTALVVNTELAEAAAAETPPKAESAVSVSGATPVAAPVTGEKAIEAKAASMIEAPAASAISSASTKTATTTTRTETKNRKSLRERIAMRVSVEYGSTLQPRDAYERSADTSMTVAPAFQINDRLKLSGNTVISRELTGEEQRTTMSNTKLSLSHAAFKINDVLAAVPAVSVTAPTNKFAINEDTFQGAVGASGRLAYDLQSKGAPISGFVGLAYDRNVHEFTINSAGSPNVRDRLTQTAVVTWAFAHRFSLSVTGSYISAWSYRQFVRNRFDLSQDLAFELNDKASIWVGHSNAGNAFKANGRDSNLALFDDHASMFRAGASYMF